MKLPPVLGHMITRRSYYGWRRGGKVGVGNRRFLKRLSGGHYRPLLAYERRRPCTCGDCGRYLPNGSGCGC